MTEEAPPQLPVDESQRIQDPEKAHVMALEGNNFRSEAAMDRRQAHEMSQQGDHELAKPFINDAEHNDKRAKEIEEEAGRQYDEEKNKDRITPFTADELVDVYESLEKDDRGSGMVELLDAKIMYNFEFWKANPELALEVTEKLASHPEAILRGHASALTTYLLQGVNVEKGIEIAVRLLEDESKETALTTVEQINIALPKFDHLDPGKAFPLLKAYSRALKRWQEPHQET
jgi:hypothetical protein